MAKSIQTGSGPCSVQAMWSGLCPINHLPVPGRYHNGSLLDPSIYRYKNNLILKNLNRGQAGEYFCKAVSDGGSAKSQPAMLSVIGKRKCV